VGFARDVDWSRVRPAIEALYVMKGETYFAAGRSILLRPRELSLGVFGTASELPGDDQKLQTRLLVLVLEQLRQEVRSVGTERWTDTPFEEAPEKTRPGSEGVALLERLTLDTFGIQVVELDYFRPRLQGGDAANPEIRISIDGPVQRSLGVRPNWIPATIFVPPGRYRLSASAPAFGLPDYRGYLAPFAREPIFESSTLEILGAAGETVELRVGVPQDKRRLSPAHQAFYDQAKSDEPTPPPPPLREIFLQVKPVAPS
jgi:hypothetical protein